MGVEAVLDDVHPRIDAPCLVRQRGRRHQTEVRGLHDAAVGLRALQPLVSLLRAQLGDEVNAVCLHQLRIEDQVVDVESDRNPLAPAPIQEPFDGGAVDASVDDHATCVPPLDVAALQQLHRRPARRCAEVPETVHGVRHPIEVAPGGGIAGDEHDGCTVRTDAGSDPDQPPEPVDQRADRRCLGHSRKNRAPAREVLQPRPVEESRIGAFRVALVRIRDPDLQAAPGRVEEGHIIVRGAAQRPVGRFEHPIAVGDRLAFRRGRRAHGQGPRQPQLPAQQPAQIVNQPARMRIRVAQQIFVGDDETPSAGRVSRKLQVVVQPQQVGLRGAGDGGGCGVGFVGPAREGSEHGVRPAQHLHHHDPFEARRKLRQPERRQAGNAWILEQQGFVRRLPPSEPFPDSHAGSGCLRGREAFLRQWCGVVPGPPSARRNPLLMSTTSRDSK